MESLYSFLEKAFYSEIVQKMEYLRTLKKINGGDISFDEFIKSDNWCMEIIRWNLDFKSKNFSINKAYAYRFRHIVICWLMGVGLYPFATGSSEFDSIFQQTWILTAFTHDYGYFCDAVFGKQNPEFLQSFGDYYLLTDEYTDEGRSVLNGFLDRNKALISASYGDIESYFERDLERRRNDDDPEKMDHGIVGGCLAFKEYFEYIEKRTELLDGIRIKEMNKTACLLTAVHNMWGCRVRKENKYQLLMALVDTIESIKRFYRPDSKGVMRPSLNYRTILDGIDIEMVNDRLTVDFSKLVSCISKKGGDTEEFLLKMCDKQVSNVEGLSGWTSLKTLRKGNTVVIINN